MAENYIDEMLETVKRICTPGKGILAADESTGTIGKRFSQINVENTEENRLEYRKLLFSTENLGDHISGVIMYDETIRTELEDGTLLIKYLTDNDIVVGIKTDKGVKPLPGTDGETTTQGLDDLDKRCKEYYNMGARFAKWRNVLKISNSCPSQLSVEENAKVLARYASISQQNGLVPIVEPEILMDGDHPIEVSALVTQRVLSAVYKALSDYNVFLEGTLLKPNMVRPGTDYQVREENKGLLHKLIAELTVKTLQRTVPIAVPGVTFLSGGMSEEEATEVLNEINSYNGTKPWYLTFSYGRALQHSVLKAWKGLEENVENAQKVLYERARLNGLATEGNYEKNAEKDSQSGESLHVSNYAY
tara:strand:- start:411 stop:1496 length:1086 start_codon:yes stop_codon:yes gene_type:complete